MASRLSGRHLVGKTGLVLWTVVLVVALLLSAGCSSSDTSQATVAAENASKAAQEAAQAAKDAAAAAQQAGMAAQRAADAVSTGDSAGEKTLAAAQEASSAARNAAAAAQEGQSSRRRRSLQVRPWVWRWKAPAASWSIPGAASRSLVRSSSSSGKPPGSTFRSSTAVRPRWPPLYKKRVGALRPTFSGRRTPARWERCPRCSNRCRPTSPSRCRSGLGHRAGSG